MASLPSQHPSLAIHMTDRATTPLISSAASSTSRPSSSTQLQSHHHHHSKQQRKRQHPKAFSTSPPSSTSSPPSSSAGSEDEEDEDDDPPSPATRQATALTSLSATALLSYDAAKRLGRGAPLRTMVEYPEAGPVVLHSYMCPMGLALGVPGRNTSSASLHTAVGAVGSPAAGSVNGGEDGGDGVDEGGGEGGGDAAGPHDTAAAREGDHHRRRPNNNNNRRAPSGPLSFALDPAGDEGGGGPDMEGIDPSDPPMLTSTVVAPRAEDLREARRATARLEKVARVFQAEWVSTGRR